MSINILIRVAFVNYSKNIGALFQSAQECVCEKGRWCICGRFSLKFPSYSRFYLSIHIFFIYFFACDFLQKFDARNKTRDIYAHHSKFQIVS